MNKLLADLLGRAALIGSALLDRKTFWIKAALGRNQMYMHDFHDGAISIGDVSEQLYSEGFLKAYHEVLTRELGPDRAADVLREVGTRGASWEIQAAIAGGVWVPRFMRPLIGTPELFDRVRKNKVLCILAQESMRRVFKMIMTEGGWGVVEQIDITADPMFIRVHNTPEHRQLGASGAPTCHVMSGIYRAYFQDVFGIDCKVTETTCQSKGDPACTFEFTDVVPRLKGKEPEGKDKKVGKGAEPAAVTVH